MSHNYNDRLYFVNEFFISIQGEGIHIGTPSLFIRFFGCNLKCSFCDTKYAIEKPKRNLLNKKTEIYQMDTISLENKIAEYLSKNSKITHIIFTGGEPLLQDIETLITLFKDKSLYKNTYTFEIETNGTILPPFNKVLLNKLLSDKSLTINVSFKFPKSSGNKEYVTKDLIDQWNQLPNIFFKFVYDPDNANEILNAISWIKNKNNILIMPLGDTRNKLIESSKKAIDFCIKNGYRFSPREHIMVYDKKRGV